MTRSQRLSTGEVRDLGFGSGVMDGSPARLLNRDGTFNVARHGLPFFQSLQLYHVVLTISWRTFFLVVAGSYALVNLVFAVAYLLCGPAALGGAQGVTLSERFWESLFFSVQTLTTVGYGHLIPQGTAANVLVGVEAFLGLSGFAVGAALTFARFSRPTARVLFSNRAVIEQGADGPSFRFRIANGGKNELADVAVRLILSMTDTVDGGRRRRFHELSVERRKIAFFPLHWTIVHPIDAASPLHDMSEGQLQARGAEFLVMITAFDDTFAQVVHARSSYRWDDVVWGARFRDMHRRTRAGRTSIDLRLLHEIERVDTQAQVFETVWDI
jgi:inward rectifier potassium channel